MRAVVRWAGLAIWLVAAAAGQAGAAGATSRPVVKDDMKREEFEKRFRAAVAELGGAGTPVLLAGPDGTVRAGLVAG